MKLLYIYIQRYGEIFEEQDFSFSDSYKVKYEKDEKNLSITDCGTVNNGFYGKCISDITAIVGKNGVGKTTLLDIIGRKFKDRIKNINLDGDKIVDRYFLIYHMEGNIFFFEGVWDDSINGMHIKKDELFHAFYFQKEGEKYQIENSFEDDGGKFRNCILYLGDRRKQNTECFRAICLKEMQFMNRISEKNIDYGEWYQTYIDLIKKHMVSSENIIISFSINPHIKEYHDKFIHLPCLPSDEVTKRIDSVVQLVNEHLQDLYRHIFSCVINYFYMNNCHEEEVTDEPIDYVTLENLLKKFFDGNLQKAANFSKRKYNKTDIRYLFDKVEEYVLENGFRRSHEERYAWNKLRDDIGILKFDKYEDYEYAMDRVWKNIEVFDSKISLQDNKEEKYFQEIRAWFKSLYHVGEYIIPGVDSFKLIMKSDSPVKEIYEVLKRYSELMKLISELNNENGEKDEYVIPVIINGMECSEGEHKIISLMSAIKSYCGQFFSHQSISAIEKNFIVLVDEIEGEMHLEWSRTLLKHISELLEEQTFKLDEKNKFFWYERGFQLQLIFTTHSPFILSDLKRESIIALEKKDGKGMKQEVMKTFAQNIQTIMANEFFIKDCYGAFAQDKMQQIIKKIISSKNISEEEEELKMVLSEIGEPILRKKLQEMFYVKIGKKQKWIEQLIKEQKEEMKRFL